MSNIDINVKVELVKSLLKKIHEGARPEELSKEFKDILSQISPFEIVLIEQRLVSEGIQIGDILKLCDLHVKLFRDYLAGRVLDDIPEGHPLDLLIKENELILKWSESLRLYANVILRSSGEEFSKYYSELLKVVESLRGLRKHYMKIQMLIFPYLERRGIVAVPRVLWGREDQIIVKLRELRKLVENIADQKVVDEVMSKALEISDEIGELVFRENKILFPAVKVLLTEGEWVAIKEMAEEIGYIVPVTTRWESNVKPIMPYEIAPEISEEQIKALPPEFRELALKRLEVDNYNIKRPGDIELSTGFLSKDEVEAIFRALPLEITYADSNDRIRFFSKSEHVDLFTRTKTILGRRLLYCHSPRLEGAVKTVVDKLRSGEKDLIEFWTKVGDRIIRILAVSVRDGDRKCLGALEVVEDLTDVLRNPEEVMKKIMVL